jgi:hypothetical protein
MTVQCCVLILHYDVRTKEIPSLLLTSVIAVSQPHHRSASKAYVWMGHSINICAIDSGKNKLTRTAMVARDKDICICFRMQCLFETIS